MGRMGRMGRIVQAGLSPLVELKCKRHWEHESNYHSNRHEMIVRSTSRVITEPYFGDFERPQQDEMHSHRALNPGRSRSGT